MAVLDAEAQSGRTVLATTHDLAAPPSTSGASSASTGGSSPTARLARARPRRPRRAYGGHLLILEGQTVLLDDAHHHDSAAPASTTTTSRTRRGGRPATDRAVTLTEPLQYEFFIRALAASAIVGVVCAVVGTYMVLRGLTFMGDALSHAAFPGVVIAYLINVPFYFGAGVRRCSPRSRSGG